MDDLISRQAALDAIMGQPPEPHYPSWYAAQIEKLPAVQPDHVADISKKVEGDCISRRAAIDIERNATVDTNPSHFEAHQKFTQFMDDVEVSSFGRWQWSNGFNTALTAVGIDLKKLPSAQPEIIRCTECKHYREYDSEYVENAVVVQCMEDRYPISETIPDGWFCAGAERKDDE